MNDRAKYGLIVFVLFLALIVVVAGTIHNRLNYTSTASALIGAAVLFATAQRKPPGDDK